MIKGTKEVQPYHLILLEKVHYVNVPWLLTGKGPMLTPGPQSTTQLREFVSVPDLEHDFVTVPLLDIQASAGAGSFITSAMEKSRVAFRRDWIDKELHAGVNDLFAVEIAGDSMEPSLSSGDVALIDKREKTIWIDGIYLFRLGDTIQIKRLQTLEAGTVIAKSDNPNYRELRFEGDHPEGFVVIGRMRWIGRMI